MLSITPFLWFDTQAEEAMKFYTSIFPRSKVISVQRAGDAVMSVTWELEGQRFMGLNAGPLDRDHLGAREDGGVELHGLFGLGVEPEKRGDGQHRNSLGPESWLTFRRPLTGSRSWRALLDNGRLGKSRKVGAAPAERRIDPR